ncbi:MAG: outer spore coat protein CotE [Bacilli bacterium]|nr:outer spore coat protein CotE [Bacilli bacterium]
MPTYKEIVTKAVIGKGKKLFKDTYDLYIEDNVDTVLGCWVINHEMSGRNDKGSVLITGSFDVNIWYSYDNNTKTSVAIKKIHYKENVNVRLKEASTLTDNSEIIIRSLKNPTCTDVKSNEKKIIYDIEKELGIEIIGDAKVKIAIEDDFDDYEIIEEDNKNINKIMNDIDNNINEDYLKN